MSINNVIFFRDCINYQAGRITERGTTTVISEMSDNSYDTSSTEADIDVNMEDASGSPTKIDAIFLKYTGDISQYVFTPTGGVGSAFTRIVPTTVDTYEGTTTSLEIGGFKHDLYELTTGTTATSARMQFAGTNIGICALMLLERGVEITTNGTGRSFSRIVPVRVDRTGSLRRMPNGGIRRVQPIGATRRKWEVDLQIEFRRNATLTAKDFTYWQERNENCVFANEFSRNPDEVYPAAFMDLEMASPYRTLWKPQGKRIAFRIGER